MKSIQFIVVAALCAVLSSCGLLKSAARIPGGMMKAVGRSAGMNVNHDVPRKTEMQERQEEENKIY